MPLFIDFHKFEEVSVDDVIEAHNAEKLIQDQYNVKYRQVWVNEEAGIIYCLVEGPDMETCELVHKLSHGNVACNMAEVDPGSFKLFMGDNQPVDRGLVQHMDGSVDKGYRYLMMVNFRNLRADDDITNLFKAPQKPVKLAIDRIACFHGRVVEKSGEAELVGVFNEAVNAVRCAKDLQQELMARIQHHRENPEWKFMFRIGISKGGPLTENSGFFKEALKQVRQLCFTAGENKVLLSSLMGKYSRLEDIHHLTVLSHEEESFLKELFTHTENSLADKGFTVNFLSKQMGISRPQLYRKLISLYGKSPNEFIAALRLEKSFRLLKKNFGNVSEVALEVGYDNPSYFAKRFRNYFGYPPSVINKSRESQ